ncbi:uncharacterized protein LOC111302286 [Durio zibethinus]|uniref:Uncharacterized protein LOC111302286 n=1 Tax=Durio zibethinus TaxID=66656 RepID=A0A6P5ZNN2_DURZI|nr:uncharacterized protein LOC111302286 [Durio zibethinus]
MGGGVMRAAAKVAGVVNTSLRGGVQVTPPSAEHSVIRVAASHSASSSPALSSVGVSSVSDMTTSANLKASWEMVDDWEFAGGVEDEGSMVGSTRVSDRGEPMARVLFGGVPSLDEIKEATADLKDALDQLYLSSPNSAAAAQVSGMSSLSNSEETKDCVACDVKAISVPKPAIQAFKLLNENPVVQSVVASIAADPNVWNAVLNNSAYMEFIQSQKTNDEFEDYGSPRSSESSANTEEYFDSSQPKDHGNPFSDFLQNIKNTVVETVNRATDFLQSLFNPPPAENSKENAGSNNFDKTIAASMMGLAVMVIMVVLLKRP